MTALLPLEQHLTLPPGYTTRPIRLDDAERLAQMYTEAQKAYMYGEVVAPDLLVDDWTTPGFNLEASSCLVLAPDGSPAGAMVVWDRMKPPVHPWLQWNIHPAHDHDVLARWLLNWGIERAKQALDECSPELRVSLRGETRSGFQPAETLYAELGFTQIRHFFRMRIDLSEAPSVPALPDGFTLRSFSNPDDLTALVQTRDDAFRDHWGYFERPLDVMIADWQHAIEYDKLFDAELWTLAIDNTTGRIAGFTMCRIEDFDDPEVAYVDVIGVRKEYRKRGLASFLLRRAFAEFWQRGRKGVALHVDGENRTGALRLYLNAGMQIERDYAVWDKELRPGVELSNLALS
jgi:mycothiol synthase